MPKHSDHSSIAPDSQTTGEIPGTLAESARATAEKVARTYYRSERGPLAHRRMARRFLIGAVWVAVGTPILFFLKFGTVDSFGWSCTIFLVALCLLSALGFYFLDKPEYHTPVVENGDWRDHIGGFWLMACAFGPFFGWVLTAPAFPLTEHNWWWRYTARAVLSVGLPVLTALPLMRYARGKAVLIAIPLLLCVTALPVWAGAGTLLDLYDGPVAEQTSMNDLSSSGEGSEKGRRKVLLHTQRVIKTEPSP